MQFVAVEYLMCDIVVTEDLPTLESFENASKLMVALTWLSEDIDTSLRYAGT